MRTLPVIVSFSLLFYCTLGYRPSSNVLENIKKVHPDRIYNKLRPDDFDNFIVMSKLPGGTFYKIGALSRNESFASISKETLIPSYLPYPLVFFPSKAGDGVYGDILYEVADTKYIKLFSLKNGSNCAYDIPGWSDISNRPHVYVMGNYMSLGPEDAVRLDTLICGQGSLPVVKVADLTDAELPRAVRDMVPACWKDSQNKTQEKYCVDDLDNDNTFVVPRANPIYHTDNLTVYGFCCDSNFQCEGDGGDRCSYFIYDHISNADFYIDDESPWTTDEYRKPMFLIPAIAKTDLFHSHTRVNASTPAPPSTTPAPPSSTPAPPSTSPVPGPAPRPGPCGFCNLSFFFGFVGGK
ncbi:unnamed protein product [Bursaphelenchus xylophilus]|nr:unnamed protein product [Bursaphelenchus xylophilus]CAG9106074.1 unnamed protein product [Bursaphelenchus xylophilus]